MKFVQQEAWNGDEESWYWKITAQSKYLIDDKGAIGLQEEADDPLRWSSSCCHLC